MARFPLRFGSAAHPIHYGVGPSGISRYHVDPYEKYPVERWTGTKHGHFLGTCRVGGHEGGYWVEPEASLKLVEPNKCMFWASWDVSDDGVADLREVFLTVGG